MARTLFDLNSSYLIKLQYRCSKCDTEAIALLPLSGNAVSSRSGYSREPDGIQFELVNEVYDQIRKQVKSTYKKDPCSFRPNIYGKCLVCGNIEPWATDPDKVGARARKKKISMLLTLLGIAVAVGLGLYFKNMILILVLLAVELVAGIVIGILTAPKRIKTKDLKSIPQQHLPQYKLTLKEALAEVDECEKAAMRKV